jgi:small subunit ribosomal protein S30e
LFFLIFLGKIHGSLARAGKVKSTTPKQEKQDKKKTPKGRALRRIKYNKKMNEKVVGFSKKTNP